MLTGAMGLRAPGGQSPRVGERRVISLATRRWGVRRCGRGVLIVEPGTERALELEEAFEDDGFHALTVASLAEAELAAWNSRFEVVLLGTLSALEKVEFIRLLQRDYREEELPLVVSLEVASTEIKPCIVLATDAGIEVKRLVAEVRRRMARRTNTNS